MVSDLFFQGLVLGFSIAAPVGPIGVLCIRRTLAGGPLRGFVTGLGTATADAIYGLVAALGLTAVAAMLVDHQTYLRLGGGLFLCYLGWTAFRAAPARQAAAGIGGSLPGDYLSAFALTLTNPLTVLSFAAVFAGVGVGGGQDSRGAALLVLGVFAGSLLWWLILSGATGLLRAELGPSRLVWVNRLSGIVIAAFGLACLLSLA
ncbi:LysE/ArgO family amino acid transporter [Anaeroselena agilis]|uniref:LysE family transporter n=1 Tax=Anaeroselena agilis TaxID=3063788 RepID=A0ABU3P2J5_9FIRM|nr:LysE family transporter [Selenomonadales bacterium 4137-cl]